MTLTISTNLAAVGGTAVIGATQNDQELTLHDDSPMLQTGPVIYAVSGGSDTAIDLGTVTAATGYMLEIKSNEDPATGAELALSVGTGGSFAAGIFAYVPPGGNYCAKHKAAVYGKSVDAAATVSANHRVVETRAP